jgi:hypothetical protein
MTSEPGQSLTGRHAEWFVPRFGPHRFRSFVGLLFLPYTGMVLSFAVIGSLVAGTVHWDRIVVIVLIYFCGLGIAAHALDALGSKGIKPWGTIFSRQQLWVVALLSLSAAYAIAVYYMIRYAPLLWPVAIIEGFFVFAYNMESFGGLFHNDWYFAFSWGFLPTCAGYILQTNDLSPAAAVLALSMGLFSLVEIKASRPYKELKRRMDTLMETERYLLGQYESILKSISLGVLLLCGGLLLWRVVH